MYLQLVAHEIAHNLGIYHDFDEKNGGDNTHNSGDCEDVSRNSIMSYGQQREIWSDCSRKNFKIYYNEVIRNNVDCMTGKLLKGSEIQILISTMSLVFCTYVSIRLDTIFFYCLEWCILPFYAQKSI